MDQEFNITEFLKYAVAAGASDEHLKVGYPPFVRKNGFIDATNWPVLTKENLDEAVLDIAPVSIRDSILTSYDIDFLYEIKGCSRFRVNYNRQMNNSGLVIRNIPYDIPTFDDLELPWILNEIVKYQNGIVLLTGPTGCGKSTTIASLINEISLNYSKHIVTLEDPVEYVFPSQRSIVSQRQLGIDTSTFAEGVKYALRQDPDIIFVGEIRDKETMEAALKAAETGHLVVSTLHTNDAVQTINRIVNMFEESNRYLVRKQLAETLRATISQRLVYSNKNKRRYPACEIMVVTPTIKDYITKGASEEIYALLSDVNIDNMISMNSSLARLVSKELITEEEALMHTDDKNELEKLFKGVYHGTKMYYE